MNISPLPRTRPRPPAPRARPRVVLVGLDTTYSEMAVDVTRKLHSLTGRPRVLLAGQPGDLEAALRGAGNRHIHPYPQQHGWTCCAD